MNKALSLTLVFLLLITNTAVAQAQEEAYKIAPEDVLQINVYEEPDLDTQTRVSSKGEITFPFIGKVHIAGLTVRQAEEKIEALLKKDYLVNPQVSVFIKEYHSRMVTVLGEVKSPGSYSFTSERPITLMEAIAMAGDFTEKADLEEIKVIRMKDGEKITIPIDVTEITEKGNKEKDIVLQKDDIIVVPESYERKISVMGEVNAPGTYEYSKENPITVMEAIAMAEWFTDNADLLDVKIIRKLDDGKDIIPVYVNDILKRGDKSKDIPLKPFDIVFVPRMYERKFSVMGEVNKPGTYELNKEKPTRVMEAIATAGGFTEKAKKNGTKVIRIRYGKKEIIPVKVTEITKKGGSEEDIVIQPDDIIFVPESFW